MKEYLVEVTISNQRTERGFTKKTKKGGQRTIRGNHEHGYTL